MAIAGAFVGLDSFGFWFDELFTLRVLVRQPDGGDLLSRIATDVHPPLYAIVLYLYAQIAGHSDVALRCFSALAACAAVVVFIASGKRAFSLPGRLFGAALATASWFWFFQSQNARSYALCLLISTGILALGLSLAIEPSTRARHRPMAWLIALMFVGSFIHFYVLFESLAILIVLAALRRSDRRLLIAALTALVVAAALYARFIIVPFTRVSLDDNWYRNSLDWYVHVLDSCLQYTFGSAAIVAVIICGAAASLGFLRRRSAMTMTLATASVAILLTAVPVIVLAGAAVSSTLLSPNFFDRNFLVVSPFLWGLSALLYDAATKTSSLPLRAAVNAALSIIVLSMDWMVTQRLPSERLTVLYEPFRESAKWIQTLPECRGQTIPVLTTDHVTWYKPGFAQPLYATIYGHYLDGFAEPRLIFMKELDQQSIDSDLVRELQRRVDGKGCSVLAWSVHNMDSKTLGRAKVELLKVLDRSTAIAAVATKEFHQGKVGYALYLAR